MCMSCPQACMTGPTTPVIGSRCCACDAFGSPVFSSTGRPSMSARIITSGPSPFSSMATIRRAADLFGHFVSCITQLLREALRRAELGE